MLCPEYQGKLDEGAQFEILSHFQLICCSFSTQLTNKTVFSFRKIDWSLKNNRVATEITGFDAAAFFMELHEISRL